MKKLLNLFCFSIFYTYGLTQCKADAGPDYTVTEANKSIDQITLGGKTPASGGSSHYSYLWKPSTGLSCSTCPNPTLTLSTLKANTTFELRVIDSASTCIDRDLVQISSTAFNNIPFHTISDDLGGYDAETNIGPQESTPKEEVSSDIIAFVDEDPQFPGGEKAMIQFIANNLRYPETAMEMAISGKCIVGFVVDIDGQISDVRVLKRVSGCPECDREAERIVRLMPKWVPGKVGGKAVKSRYQIPVNYKLAN